MKGFRTKEMSIKVRCTCVSDEYFRNNLRDYYSFLAYDLSESKKYGFYFKTFYKLISFSELICLGLDVRTYSEMPTYICSSKIY